MTQEWINQKIKESHENAVEKGFYKCNNCYGQGYFPNGDGTFLMPKINCQKCNETGIYRNIGELLMLIITELSEAVEAHRKNKFADFDNIEMLHDDIGVYKIDSICISYFEESIKDTFEDELANTFIRLFDLCGYIKFDLSQFKKHEHTITFNSDNICDMIYRLTSLVSRIHNFEGKQLRHFFILHFFAHLLYFCNQQNIDIKKHIELKMAYNKTRPHKHGKEY